MRRPHVPRLGLTAGLDPGESGVNVGGESGALVELGLLGPAQARRGVGQTGRPDPPSVGPQRPRRPARAEVGEQGGQLVLGRPLDAVGQLAVEAADPWR